MPNTPTIRASCHFQDPCHNIAVVVFHSTGNLSSTTAAGAGPSPLEEGGVKLRTRAACQQATTRRQNEQTEVYCGQLDCGREAGGNQQAAHTDPGVRGRGGMQHTSTQKEC